MSTLVPAKTTFERILIPTDFTDASQRAVEYAEGIAREDHSELLMVHVKPILSTINPDVTRISERALWCQAEEQLEEDGAELRSKGFRARTISATGKPEDEILAAASRESADLIVLSTHAETGIERLLFGSAAEALLRKASCPVLVLGPRVPALGDQVWHPKRMVCASDLAAGSAPVVAYAYILAERYRASFTLLHIEDPKRKTRSDDLLRFERALARELPNVPILIETLRTRLSEVPGVAIIDFVMDMHADLIVMGAHTASMSATHFLRGIGPQVFAKAPCPVMVMHFQR